MTDRDEILTIAETHSDMTAGWIFNAVGIERFWRVAYEAGAAAEREAQHEDEQGPVAYRLHETDIYDFAGWLTTRPGLMLVGSGFDAALMAEAVGEYIRTFPERFSK